MSRFFTGSIKARCLTLLVVALLSACGGGGGGGSDEIAAAEPPTATPEPQPEPIALTDSVPTSGAADVDAGTRSFNFSHLAQSDLAIALNGDCTNLEAVTIRRDVSDLSTPDFTQIIDHHVRCELSENTGYTVDANGTRDNDDRYIATQSFATGTSASSGLTVIDQLSLTPSLVNDAFRGYVEGALISELDVPGAIGALVVDLVIDLAEANWRNLTDPQALYPVASQRVNYLSRTPAGSPTTELTGLVVRPVVNLSPDFAMRDRVIVLTHATGSTPGDLNPADAWFILANQFASRGYLVIAPDNYGRGGTSANPETYLMANRSAYNALDLIEQVMADTAYDDIYDGNAATVIGYSQGGHTAMALWQLIETTKPSFVNLQTVYAGGAPHNLYQTVRGVLRHLDGSCNDEPYCEFVDSETTVPFATDRILPGLLTYTDSGLALSDVVTEDTLAMDFVSGFLADEAPYDDLKALLHLNSFTSISNPELFSDSTALVHLYHSAHDRLVPIENTDELATLLSPHVTVDHHENRCNSNGYQLIANLTDKVGVLHTLCGLSVLDDAMEDLK